MQQLFALAFCLVLLALAVFQVALIAGAPLGHLAWGGRDRVLPRGKRIGSVISVVLYVLFGLVALERAEITGLVPDSFDGALFIAMWVIAGYLAVGILLNAASRSKQERAVMTLTALVLAILAALVALG
ncbi:hypothetical protein [Herbiconiux sp. L3-i23]|uniref:hypothetical protein n=1 Tax=Herbiconiux sp. L3-i23 TaxID=2905871 RepID=UPI002072C01D|nr:hypothetical protein [Herbiconiux sp. L3-i23]